MAQLWELSQRVEGVLDDIGASDFGAVSPESALAKVTALAEAAKGAAEQGAGPEWNLVQDTIVRKLPAIVSSLASNKDLGEATAAACDVITQVLLQSGQPPSLEAAVQIKKAALGLLVSAKTAKAKIAGCNLAIACFERSAGVHGIVRGIDVPQCLKLLLNIISQGSKNTPTVLQHVNECLGQLCKSFSTELRDVREDILRYFLSQLETQMSQRTKSPELPIIEGCLRGLNHFLTAFGLDDEDQENRESIYDRLLQLCKRPDQSVSRRGAMRTALDLLASHASLFAPFLVGDRKYWFDALHEWAFSRNRDDHKAGWKAIVAYLRVVGKQLGEEANEDAFRYFLQVFKKMLSDRNATRKEATLAILGYGHLAGACRKTLSASEVSIMLCELLIRTDAMLFGKEQMEDDFDRESEEALLALPMYIEAIATVIGHVDLLSASCSVMSKNIVTHCIRRFPKLPVQYRGFAVDAVATIVELVSSRFASESDFAADIVYQSVLASCSFPLLSAEEEAAATAAFERPVTVEAFVPFWTLLFQRLNESFREHVYDCLMTALLSIAAKLDLSVVEVSNEGEDDEAVFAPASAAKCAKDHTVLTNLVRLTRDVLTAVSSSLFGKWVATFGCAVVSLSSVQPEVSGYHRLLSLTLEMCDRLSFWEGTSSSDVELCRSAFSEHLRFVLEGCGGYEGELLHSCLLLSQAVPGALAPLVVTSLHVPLKRIFAMNNTDLKLVQGAVAALTKWKATISNDSFDAIITIILKDLINFLRDRKVDVGEFSDSRSLSKSRRRRKSLIKATKPNDVSSNDQEQVQKEVVSFLSQLDLEVLLQALPDKDEVGGRLVSVVAGRGLDFDLPFPDVRPNIRLDVFLPRVLELCENATHRRTRVAACECLHVVIVYLVGRTASQPAELKALAPLYVRVFPTMLRLASDETDTVVAELFRPLTLQCIHWFTRNREFEAPEAVCLLDSILDCLCEETNASLRNECAGFLAEFLKWSIKQTPPEKMSQRAFNPKSVFLRLYAMWVHPNATRRLAASLAFNSLYRIFREEEPLVNQFTLEIFVHVVLSLSAGADAAGADASVVAEARKSIAHLVRIIKQKVKLLEKCDASRRTPHELDGNRLQDLVVWLFSLVGHSSDEARHVAMEAIYQFTDAAERSAAFKASLKKKEQSAKDFLGCLESEAAAESPSGVLRAIECISFLLDCGLIDSAHLPENRAMFKRILPAVIEKFINDPLGRSSEVVSQKELASKKTKGTLLARLLDFLAVLGKHNVTDPLGNLITTPFWTLTLKMIFDPEHFGVNTANLQKQSLGLLSDTLSVFRQKCPQSVRNAGLPSLLHSYELGEPLADAISGKNLHRLAHLVRGYSFLLSCGLHAVDVRFSPRSIVEQICSSRQILRPEAKRTLKDLMELAFQVSKPDAEELCHIVRKCAQVRELAFLENALLQHASESAASVVPRMFGGDGDDFGWTLKWSLKLLRFAMNSKGKDSGAEVCGLLLEQWPRVDRHAAASAENLLSVIFLLKVMSLNEKCASVVLSEDQVAKWYFAQLQRPETGLRIKAKMLDLLPVFVSCKSVDCFAALNAFASVSFPLESTSLEKGSVQLSEYVEVVEKLLACFDSTRAASVLTFLTKLICGEPNHVSLDSFRSSLMDMEGSTSTAEEVALLNNLMAMVINTEMLPSSVRHNIVDHVLVPLLSASRKLSVYNFFSENISVILDGLLHSPAGTEVARTDVLVTKIASCKLIGSMYGQLDRDKVHSQSSQISRSAVDFLKSKTAVKAETFTGKEMSQFLVAKLTSFRSEVLDGTWELRNKFRIFQCSAVNAMIAIISRLQDQEKFYNTFVFKENVSKSELIWSRIVDTERSYSFPLELTEMPARKKMAAAVRQVKEDNASDAGRRAFSRSLSSSFLSDSSLSQDASFFDFTQASGLSSTKRGASSETEEKDQVVVTLDADDINDHECMAAFVALIGFMDKAGIYERPLEDQQPQALPGWIESLRVKLTDEETHRNVRFFLVRLIINCSGSFKPFARLLLPDLLHQVAEDRYWGSNDEMDSLRLDLLTLLLSWSDLYVPSGSLMEKTFAGSILERVLTACRVQSNRQIAKYLIEIARTLVQVWRQCLPSSVATKLVFDWLSDCDRRQEQNGWPDSSAMEVLEVLLGEKVLPVTSGSLIKPELFWKRVVDVMSSETKQLYGAAASVLGSALAVYAEMDNSVFSMLRDLVQTQLDKLRRSSRNARDRERFLEVLYYCHLKWNDIVSPFYKGFVYELSSKSGGTLTKCLTMLAAVSNDLYRSENGLAKELAMIGISKYLHHFEPENVISACSFLLSLVPFMDVGLLEECLNGIHPLMRSSSSRVREKVVAIAERSLVALASSSAKITEQQKVRDKALVILTKGLSDTNQSICTSIVEFFDQEESLLGSSTVSRAANVLRLLLNAESQDNFLMSSSNLVLALTKRSPEMSRKIYSAPLSEMCRFQDQFINTSWRSQKASTSQTPRFAETYSSQSQSMYIRATQTSLEFDQTQTTDLQGLTETSANTSARSYKQNRSFGRQNLADTDETDDASRPMGALRVGKRFVQKPDFDRTKAYFARAHARSEERNVRLRKDEVGRRAAGVTLMRKYRLGDLPDVEITYEDVVKSIRNLCVKDELSARTFLRMVFESFASANHEEDEVAAIKEGLDLALKTDGIQNRELCASIFELSILFPDAVMVEKVIVLSKHFHLEGLGILMLEKLVSGEDNAEPPSRKKRKKQDLPKEGDTRLTWTAMMELYRSAGDYDSARGIAFQSMQGSAELQEALRAESEEDWMRAKSHYRKELESGGGEQEWQEALMHSMEKLSEWEDLASHVDKLRGASPSFLWDSEKAKRSVLPRFLCSNLHRLVEDSSKPNDIFSQAELCRSNEQNFSYMKRNHGIELALLYAHQGKLGEARLCAEVLKESHLAAFTSSELSERNIFGLFRFGELQHFLQALDDQSATNRTFDLDRLERNVFMARTDLQSSDAILCDRSIYLKCLVAEEAVEAPLATRVRCSGYLALCAEGVSRRHFHVAVRMLRLAQPLMAQVDDPALKADFQTHYADAIVLKCLKDSSASLKQRFNALYRSYMDCEGETEAASPKKCARTAKLLEALQELAKEYGDGSQIFEIAENLSPEDKQRHFSKLAKKAVTVKDLRGNLLTSAVRCFDGMRSVPAEHSLELASLCYRLWSDFGVRDDATVQTLFSSHVTAVNEGSREAVDLFPKLLEVLRAETTSPSQQQHFRQSLVQVKEPWRLLPWKNQLLSYLGGPLGRFVLPLITSMAKQFPQALIFPYVLSKETHNFNFPELDELLRWSPLTARLVQALGNVCLPLVKVYDLVDAIHSSDKSAGSKENLQRFQEVRKQIAEKSHVFGDLYWSCKAALNYLDRAITILKKERNPNIHKELAELLKNLKADFRSTKPSPALEDYSMFLSNFHPGAFDESLEIPGQYDGFQMPNPSGHVRLCCFERDVVTFSSIRMPIKVTLVGDDGKRYPFIVKCGEDLRQDERVEQVFGVANRLLRRDFAALSIHTYAVLPLDTTLGLIECVENTVTYKALTVSANARVSAGAGVDSFDGFRSLMRLPPEKRKQTFLETVAKSDSNALRRNLLARSHSPQGFFFLRDTSCSHGVHSAVGWLLSLGDRHADNLLVSSVTGRSIPIDFGYAFGTNAFLPIPELPPFRLTPNIQNLMLPFRNQGCLRESMVQALGCLVANKSVVRTLLDVFITEPTLDWLKLAAKRLGGSDSTQQKGHTFARNKMTIVEKKLACRHPVDVVIEELRQGIARPEDMMKQIESVLLGDDGCKRNVLRSCRQIELSVSEVVDCLLEAAVDPALLASTFRGWNPHL